MALQRTVRKQLPAAIAQVVLLLAKRRPGVDVRAMHVECERHPVRKRLSAMLARVWRNFLVNRVDVAFHRYQGIALKVALAALDAICSESHDLFAGDGQALVVAFSWNI
jgi:hypothetical protein